MIQSKIVWKIDPRQALEGLSNGIKNKAVRIALNAGAAPVKAAVIAQAPSGVGNLKKAIRIKVKSYRNSNSWVAIIGASTSYKRQRKLKDKKRDRGGSKVIRPARYQPLVNRGTKNFSGKHFMEAALSRSRQAFEQNVRRKLQEVIPQLIGRR